jgi:hypothetical protein
MVLVVIDCRPRQCFRTHTLWNGRIDEIRLLILCGLASGDFEGF